MAKRQKEIILLAALMATGHKWLVREEKEFWAFSKKPRRRTRRADEYVYLADKYVYLWKAAPTCEATPIDPYKLFSEVTIEDKKPTNIHALLCRKLSEEFEDTSELFEDISEEMAREGSYFRECGKYILEKGYRRE